MRTISHKIAVAQLLASPYTMTNEEGNMADPSTLTIRREIFKRIWEKGR